jgi:hypothetical protein
MPKPPAVGGPRFGRGPLGIRKVAAADGGVRSVCGSLGGGMSCEGVGAPFRGLRVGGLRTAEGALALWAELRAGKEGGGILSASSSLSSLSPVFKVNEGTAGRFPLVVG